MSSGFWKKNGHPGIFGFGGSHKKGLWSPGHDPMTDGAQEWDELEKEYYKDFGRRTHDANANPVDHQYKYEDQTAGENQTEKISHSDTFRGTEETEDQKTPVDGTSGGAPYREETMKITNVRRGGHKRLTDLISNRFSNRFRGGGGVRGRGGDRIPPETRPVNCEECGGTVSFQTCVQCSKYRVWHEKDEGPMCYHEYKDLESRGHYDGTWADHRENYTPEEWQQYQEEKRNIERVNKEMEREKPELERLAKEQQKDSYTIHDHIKFVWGDYDAEEDDADFDEDHDSGYGYDDEEEYY